MLIRTNIVKGRGSFSIEWPTRYSKTGSRWALININKALAILDRKVEGDLKIGQVTMQRKGRDQRADIAKMLQFKINSTLFSKFFK